MKCVFDFALCTEFQALFYGILCILTLEIQYGDCVDCECLFKMKAVVGISSPKTVVLNFHVEYD